MSESQLPRAELLADLGRYEEAASELSSASRDDAAAQTLLARVKLAAGAPKEALAAADAAVAADPTALSALIARGMVLADLGRADEAAAQAEGILRQGNGSGYACTSAAAILAEVRNGQMALDAAWEGVRLTPDQPRAHLVLGVVAAGLGLDEIASRAYQEALALDPRLPVAQAALGVARTEQHRYAQALSHLADEPPAAPRPAARNVPPSSRPGGRPRPAARAEPAATASPNRLGRTLSYAAGYAACAPLLVAWSHGVGIGAAPVAVLLALGGLVAAVAAGRRLAAGTGLGSRLRRDRSVAVAAIGIAVAPVLLASYVMVGAVWPLVVASAAGAAGLFAASRVRPS